MAEILHQLTVTGSARKTMRPSTRDVITVAGAGQLRQRRLSGDGREVHRQDTAGSSDVTVRPDRSGRVRWNRRRDTSHRFRLKNAAMRSLRNRKSAGLLAAPAVWPHNDGIGVNVTRGMNACS